MMVPDCQRRLESAIADLQAAVDDCDDSGTEFAEEELELVSAARALLNEDATGGTT